MTRRRYTLAELNRAQRDEFVGMVGPAFEHSPWIAEATWPRRPFTDMEGLHGALCATVNSADEGQQLALIRAHPDLAGRAALAGTLTPASTGEQSSAGLNKLTANELAQFQSLNRAYRDKFGFPFVICARLNNKEAILTGFRVRLEHSRAEEIKTALGEIGKIAYLRLKDIVTE
jgi:2-oxo-4-hydroxy-4-carboxy-5-ureidoimidazoline decarboxylase